MTIPLGLLLLAVGAGLLAAEAHLPTAGILGALGVGALAGGTVALISAAGGGVAFAVPVAVVVVLITGAVVAKASLEAARAGRRRPRGGSQGIVGHVGVIRRAPEPVGQVFVDGALWRARPEWPEHDEELHEGDHVIVERVSGLTLCVRKADPGELI